MYNISVCWKIGLLCSLLWTSPLHDVLKAYYPDAGIHNAGDCPLCQHGMDTDTPPENSVFFILHAVCEVQKLKRSKALADNIALNNPRRGPPVLGGLPERSI